MSITRDWSLHRDHKCDSIIYVHFDFVTTSELIKLWCRFARMTNVNGFAPDQPIISLIYKWILIAAFELIECVLVTSFVFP